MKCRYCNVVLAPLRSLTDGEFCCDSHREMFRQQGETAVLDPTRPSANSLVDLHAALSGAGEGVPFPATDTSGSEDFPTEVIAGMGLTRQAQTQDQDSELPVAGQLLRLNVNLTATECHKAASIAAPIEAVFSGKTMLPRNTARPVSMPVTEEPQAAAPDWAAHAMPDVHSDTSPETGVPAGEDDDEGVRHPSVNAPKSLRWLGDVWRKAPSDLKFVTVLLPILLAVAIGPSVPKISIAQVNPGGVQQMVSGRWKDLHQTITNRAAVAFADDFRSGLDAWESRSNLTTSWSYDATGFVQPGPLAVFKPSIGMTDYRFEFLGEIDQKGMGCAFRAKDLNNFYALKFTVVKPGPMPMIRMVRYAVIDGKEGPHVEKPLPMTVSKDMLYRVMLNVVGSDFTIMAQGQIVDFWSDSRLKRGGVGFFCGRGEKARVRWVEVSHQYDTLGRLCAYLAPYGIESRNGNWN
jgi:hypothetical protein